MIPAEPDAASPGLRERKRLATRRAIQRAAMRVVRERGLDGATVDEISRLADVSPRTFFNYFPTKEDAILGDTPSLVGGAAFEGFVADREPILRGLATVVIEASERMMGDVELLTERRELSRLYPEIGLKRMANAHRFEEEVAELALRRLRSEHPELSDDDATSQARLVGLTVIAFAKHAWFTWLQHPDGSSTLPELLEASFALGTELLGSSLPASSVPARVG